MIYCPNMLITIYYDNKSIPAELSRFRRILAVLAIGCILVFLVTLYKERVYAIAFVTHIFRKFLPFKVSEHT